MKLDIQYFADGKVVIETDLDTKSFESGLGKLGGLAEKGAKAIGAGVGAVSGALVGVVGKAVKSAGDLEQQMGGTEAVFGNFASTVQDKAVKAFDQMGVSANDYMATANKMGALMQGSGLSIEESMNLSTQAMQRAADVASIMGIDTNAAMEAVAGAAKGNFTMMDNLGVAMNATNIEAYALSKGITTSYNEMDQATKVGLAMEMFLEKSSYAAGNYTKENETFAGSFSTLKAATQNFLSGAGGIEAVSDALIKFADILTDSIGKMAPQITEGIAKLIKNIIPEIPELLNSLLPTVVSSAIDIINSLATIFPQILEVIQQNLPTIVQGVMSIIQQINVTLIEMLPQILEMGILILIELTKGIAEALPELIPTIVKVVMDICNILLDHIDEIIEAGIQILVALTEGIMNALPELVARLPEIIIKITNTLINLSPQLLSAALRIIMALAEGLIKYTPEMISRIPQIIKSMVSALGQGVKDFVNIGANLLKGLWEGISNTKKWLLDKVSGIGKAVKDKVKDVLGIHSPSRVFRDEIGKNLALGLGLGFEDEIGNVYDKMQNAVDLETSKMNANVESNGTYQMAMAGLPTFNLTNDLVVEAKVDEGTLFRTNERLQTQNNLQTGFSRG